MDVSKNLNPFLFDEPAPAGDGSDPAMNPFLADDTYDYQPVDYASINPFSDNLTDSVNIFASAETFSAGINPFGDISEPNVNIFSQPGDVAPDSQFDIFGSSAQPPPFEETIFGNSVVEPPRPPRPPSPRDLLSGSPQPTDPACSPGRPPPPRPPPPSKETKDLLQTVIGAIEATTDTLQEKLITTRTPCPSPGSGIQHSRSPTPDIQITAPEKEPDAFSTVFGQTIELSDPEMDDAQAIVSNTDNIPDEPQSNEIDLFGDISSQSKPRTTQDILNLYSKPKDSDSNQVDFLSGDLIDDNFGTADGIDDEHTQKINENIEVQPLENKDTALNNSVSESRILEATVITNQSGSHLDQGYTDALVSPEQISDKSGSEPTVIETDIYDNQVKGDLSAVLTETLTQTTFMPVESIGEYDADGTECQSDLPSAIFSTGSTPPLNENDGIRKNSMGPVNGQTDVRKASIGSYTEQNSSRKESIGSYSEQIGSRKGSMGSHTEQVAPRRVSIEPFTGEISRKESIGSNAEDVASRKEPIGSCNGQVTTRKESIGSYTETRKESIGATAPSTVYNTEIGIVERSDVYMSALVQRAEPKTDMQANVVDMGQKDEEPQAIPQEALFGDLPSSTVPPPSTGFSIFGDDISSTNPIPGSESTGATLFETEAPAPNVGMSLFGSGQEATLDIFAESKSNTMVNPFAPTQPVPAQTILPNLKSQKKKANQATEEEFDAFSARFDSVPSTNVEAGEASFDPFASSNREAASSPWGGQAAEAKGGGFGFDDNAQFDSFLALNEPPPPPKRRRIPKQTSADSNDGQMNIVIKPMAGEAAQFPSSSPVPVLAPPPAVEQSAFTDSTPRFNPFDRSDALPGYPAIGEDEKRTFERSDSQETPPTPLFEEDQSVPLEQYPRTLYDGRTFEMYLRQPNKKKITGQSFTSLHIKEGRSLVTNRFWKKIYVKITEEGALQLYNNKDDKEPFQELPFQPCYSVSDIGAQQFDQFGKIFTIKVQYIFYKERPGVRPGQVSKAERITTKLSKFAQYAIAGDYEGVKEFASDVRKLGMPVEHAPQISQLLKLGTQNYEELKLFASLVEENMFKLVSTRERALNYKMEEVQLTAVDETFVEQDLRGAVLQMVARVRIFFLAFLSGMSEVDLGINDLRKQGHEVVGRHDIIPVVTEEWIRLEDIEFHCTVDKEEFDKTRHIRFSPPDACYIELMRYRVRPPKNRELPLQVKTKFIVQGKQVDIQCEILVPGFSGRKLGQVPCEDIAVRFPLPECWIYMFRVEKHFRYGSVKSAHRRTGKVKGIERFKGTVESAESALMEVTSGQAKYEHQHRAIVWRMSRLPKEGQGAYSVHQFTCKMYLTSYDQIPPTFDKHCMVEFTMPATTVSHCVMRSVSVSSDDPPEKYVRYLSRHEYKVEIEFSSGSGPGDYIAATKIEPERNEERKIEPVGEESSSDESG